MRLDAEVEFLGEVVGEVGDHVLGGKPPAGLGQFGHLGEALEDLKVGGHPAPDTRPLDLDDDLLAGMQGGEVHLGDRGRGERFLGETGEQLRGVCTEFGGEQFVYLGGISRRYRVEQAAELP